MGSGYEDSLDYLSVVESTLRNKEQLDTWKMFRDTHCVNVPSFLIKAEETPNSYSCNGIYTSGDDALNRLSYTLSTLGRLLYD